jgi:molybdopterin/thiamine biosynthesis adenylyltransferase
MGVIRIPQELWSKTLVHLYSTAGEHFAFFLASWTYSSGRPVFLVHEVVLISDDQVEVSKTGWTLAPETVVGVINAAVKAKCALIEVHNHGGTCPRFSGMDRLGFREFVPYVLDSLPGRPYGATVWGDTTVYAEYFLPGMGSKPINSIVVYGDRLDQVASKDDDSRSIPLRFDRQLPWFTEEGQRKLARLKVGVAGIGGTGSPLVQNLVYLGVRDFVLIDDDNSDETSMNRLVTATSADIGKPKTVIAQRLIKEVAQDSHVRVIQKKVQSKEALDALKGVDILFGCFDNDGARLILNELAVAYHIPYFDTGVGINAEDGTIENAGGRLAVVLPGGPCLSCMGEIDPDEAGYYLASDEQREFVRRQGYVKGLEIKAPSVVSLNAALAAAAVNEFAIYISGLRQIHPFTEFDILGVGRKIKSQWMTPVRVEKKPGCPVCANSGAGDQTGIEMRYARTGSD